MASRERIYPAVPVCAVRVAHLLLPLPPALIRISCGFAIRLSGVGRQPAECLAALLLTPETRVELVSAIVADLVMYTIC